MYKTILSPAVLLTLTTMAVALPAQADGEYEQVSLDTCLESAHAVHQGDFVKVEYLSVSPAGAPAYEIDLQQPDQDNELKVEIDAANGDIIETSIEQWQIGQEPEEEVESAQSASGAS